MYYDVTENAMCGIIGYSGQRSAISLLIEGLHRLEYRGYDSSGAAFMQEGHIQMVKTAGKLLSALEKTPFLQTVSGMGPTHGLPMERNAHPHFLHDGRISHPHNGIIENFH